MTAQDASGRASRRTGRDIHQVAKRAGVSPATVSRVTNGKASVDKKLASRVWKAIEELGYTPNPQARALVSGRSRTLGLLISEMTNPFFPELIQIFEDIASENDYELMVGSTNYNRKRAELFIRRLVQRRVEGVALMTFRSEADLLHELIAREIPLVSIEESTNGPLSQVLEVDYAQGINEAMRHLAGLGHRRIGFASGPMPHLTNVRRKEAFELAARAIGLAVGEAPVFIGEHTFEGGKQAAEYFVAMKKRPTAIVCSNDLMAVGVVRGLVEKKIEVPRQMSVIGFDDIHLAEFANPPLSTVRMAREELARSAFNALMQLRQGKHGPAFEPRRISTRLILRQSTEAPERVAVTPRRARSRPAGR